MIIEGKIFEDLYLQPTRDKYGLPKLSITTRPNPSKDSIIITLQERVHDTSLISWAEIPNQEILDADSFVKKFGEVMDTMCKDFVRMKAKMLIKELR